MTAGVYTITCTATGEQYVGISANIPARWRAHKIDLCGNRHANHLLQSAWTTHGADAFLFTVVEEVSGESSDRTTLLELEKDWIDRLCPAFNIGGHVFGRERRQPKVLREKDMIAIAHGGDVYHSLESAASYWGRKRAWTVMIVKRCNVPRYKFALHGSKIFVRQSDLDSIKNNPPVICES